MTERRAGADRRPVSLLVKLAYQGVDEFAEKYATNLSPGGMFIRSREPLPVGTVLRFRVELAHGARVLQGRATVQWVRAAGAPDGPSGMGVKFTVLDGASNALIQRMLAATRPAPAPASAPASASAPAPAPSTPAPAATAPSTAKPAAPPPPPTEHFEIDVDLDSVLAGEPPAPPPPPFEPEPDFEPPLLTPTGALEAPAETAPPRPQVVKPVYLAPPPAIPDGGPVIGIDLGTTNSAAAVVFKNRPQILRSKEGYATIPSVIALDKRGQLVVGHRGHAQRVLNPKQSIYGAKRLVGRDFDSPTVQQVRDRYHYAVVPGPDGRAAVELGGQTLSLEEVQGLVLRECKRMAEEQLGQQVHRAVITCPAYYSEQQREAVRRAAAMTGLKVERVLNEPTAAALAYGLKRELSKKVLVYDLGGGTFDATVMQIDGNAFEVLATGGDVFLGGMDFDNQVVDVLLERYQKQHKRAFQGDAVALSRVAEAAERSKVALSERQSYEVMLPMLEIDEGGNPLELRTTLTREELNAACKDLVERTLDVVRDVLLDAKLKAAEVDDVILVGGMSRMPLVREALKGLFGKMPQASVNADEAVALGAALYASTVDTLSTVLLIDVVPMTIGVGLPGGAFKRVIERNTPLPASRSFPLATSKNNEQFIELNVFQGEDAQLLGNDYLGTVRLEDLPRGPKGTVKVAVTLALDPECVLTVHARELSTRKTVQSSLATRYTTESLKAQLRVPELPRSLVEKQRAEELKARGGRFWGFLKGLVGR